MTPKEMLVEIESIKRRIALLPEGSVMVGELTVALVVLYDSYVYATRHVVYPVRDLKEAA